MQRLRKEILGKDEVTRCEIALAYGCRSKHLLKTHFAHRDWVSFVRSINAKESCAVILPGVLAALCLHAS